MATSEILIRGDEHWIYYQGEDCQHHGARSPDSKGGQIGLATLRLDGFVCLEARDGWGQVTTRPFELEGDTLEVNVDASDGSFHVEILDATGGPVAGFSDEQAVRYSGVDEVRLKTQWENHKDLSTLKGQTIRLRVHLNGAKLYAFQIQPN